MCALSIKLADAMRALVSRQPPYAELAEVPDPQPLPHQALVAVGRSASTAARPAVWRRCEPGTVTGWDLAGVVQRAGRRRQRAAGGRPRGRHDDSRRLGAARGGDTDWLAELPDGVSLRAGRDAPGGRPDGAALVRARRVRARQAGAGHRRQRRRGAVCDPAGQARRRARDAVARRTEGLRELGADEVLHRARARRARDFDVVLDAIGGPVLGAALQRVAPRGIVVSFASTLTEPVSYPTRELFARAPGRSFTASTSSPSCSTPARARRPAPAGRPGRRGPAGPAIDVCVRGPRRARRSMRCWTAAWPARPCSPSTDGLPRHAHAG